MYMAPEVFRAERYKESADVFSFALVLLEIVSGVDVQSWFEEEGVELRSAAAFHAAGKRLDLSEELVAGRHTAEEVSALELVERCWHPDPGSRPSMSECVEALSTARGTGDKSLGSSFKTRTGPKQEQEQDSRRKARERGKVIASLWEQTAPGLSDDEQEELFRRISEVMERQKKAEEQRGAVKAFR